MNTTQDILNLLVAAGFLIVTICIVYITYYLVQALKSVTNLTDSLGETTQNIKDKIQMKALTVIPALVVALIGRILKRGR
ncbi:hypothetical protein A2867_04345 [Candidatus Daviesbacteria bacterium RIFCSPHIGHO2_01_FULL_40_11]|uniref:Uncharacterized protein n=1 Tax=Candidatus Daviesbacteria bacterium RIFCSPHIGHO2_01_FULL_40_11 TaxID=1797762 RepID=A0A1F5JJ09_9BACT|nr:MAG: hypothetical protein A2867_04345 [Candidatus Daviesbacteria bacterium RIFCSPHIGHO2_01_FULL_40_11]OGE62731.1 MAG: hypothetical protein A2964_01120 [Candidatus Daviesbacteria bacterium RIFCSPLOWO2_01_FULL_40_27]